MLLLLLKVCHLTGHLARHDLLVVLRILLLLSDSHHALLVYILSLLHDDLYLLWSHLLRTHLLAWGRMHLLRGRLWMLLCVLVRCLLTESCLLLEVLLLHVLPL